MEIRLWRELLIPYELAVKELVMKFNHLKKEHQEKDLYSPIEEVTGRVKSINSILEKMQRKNISWEELEYEGLGNQGLCDPYEGQRIPELSYDHFLCHRDPRWEKRNPGRNSDPHPGYEFLGNYRAFPSV